ncbi:hypothetical protein Glove_734g10 [Diversispora epigaea]|uniref:Uncharacterized protein n=1 Tax=Diversispora epigaea TaxID=1348612 RepID=A0A397G4Y1_9GLOM|nr:hypothetical protein Glove_734g10 [Diversispora epigaea]
MQSPPKNSDSSRKSQPSNQSNETSDAEASSLRETNLRNTSEVLFMQLLVSQPCEFTSEEKNNSVMYGMHGQSLIGGAKILPIVAGAGKSLVNNEYQTSSIIKLGIFDIYYMDSI